MGSLPTVPARKILWNPVTGKPAGVLPGRFALVTSLAFSPDGRLLAAGGLAGTTAHPRQSGLTRVWDLNSGALVATLPDRGATVVHSVAFSPDGRLLASAGNNSLIKLWDPATRRAQPSLRGYGDITAVAFNPDGVDITATGSDGLVRNWYAAPPRAYFSFDSTYTGGINTLSFSKNGRTLLVGGTAGAVLRTQHVHSLPIPAAVTSVAFSHDGRLAATADLGGAVRLWNAATHWPVRLIGAHPGGAETVAFSPDGRLLASGGRDGHVRLWNPVTGAPAGALRAVGPDVSKVAFSPDGALLAAASWAYNPATPKQASAPGAIEVWDAHTHALLARTPSQGSLAGPAFAPGGSLLAYGNSRSGGGAGGTVVLADARTLRPVGPLLSSSSVVRDVTFSPDGRLVAAGEENGTVALWDARTRRPLRTIKAGTQQITAIAFSPDGTTLAAGSLDNMVRLFDVRTGALIAVLNDHTDRVNDVVFSPDGRTLASAGADDAALLWGTDPRAAVARLCQALRGPSLAGQWAALRTGLGGPPCEIGPAAQAARLDQSGGSIPSALR